MASSSVLESVYHGLTGGNLSALLPPGTNLSSAIAHASKTLEHVFSGSSQATSTQPSTWQDTLSSSLTSLTDFLAGRTALENTSVLLALCTLLVLAMSWSSRLGNLGRFSPFTRSPPSGSTKVSDADFSYITADDLRKHQAESEESQHSYSQHRHTSQPRVESPVEYGPPRDTDVLILKNKKKEYTVHFPAYSIAKGELTIGQVRDHAAKKTGAADPRRIKLLHRGKNLKDDMRTCKAEGLRDGSELMCTFADSVSDEDDDDDDDSEFAELDNEPGADGESRRRRNRGKKTKRRNKRLDPQNQTSGTSTPSERERDLPIPAPGPSHRAPSPAKPSHPGSGSPAMDKLDSLHATLRTFLPDCEDFKRSPPSDPSKRDFEHKRLSETILAQVLLKLDAVETEGDADARARRKELVRETQKILSDLDVAVRA